MMNSGDGATVNGSTPTASMPTGGDGTGEVAQTSEGTKPKRKRGGGPQTESGKWKAAQNSLKHGLLSSGMTVLDERDRYLFIHFGVEMETELAPQGEMEHLLADRIITSAWRLRRVLDFEWRILFHLSYDSYSGKDMSTAVGLIQHGGIGLDAVSKLNRYEVMIERGMYRALHELQRLQAARRGENVQPPAVLDIDVTTDAKKTETLQPSRTE